MFQNIAETTLMEDKSRKSLYVYDTFCHRFRKDKRLHTTTSTKKTYDIDGNCLHAECTDAYGPNTSNPSRRLCEEDTEL